MRADLVIRGPCPSAPIARLLWAGGVYVPDAVELVEGWGSDLERAWRECNRLELVLPLALLRGARLTAVAGVARAWLLDLRTALEGTPSGLLLTSELRDLGPIIDAPDVDKHELVRRKLGLFERSARTGHHVRSALAYLVDLHLSSSATAMHAAHLVGVHCLETIHAEGRPRSGQLELGVAGVDCEGCVRRSLARAKGLIDRNRKESRSA